jgi:hypothetical protein
MGCRTAKNTARARGAPAEKGGDMAQTTPVWRGRGDARQSARLPIVVIFVIVAAALFAPMARAAGPSAPTVADPPAGVHGFPFQLGCCYYNFADVGYTLQEYLVSGTAKTYTDPPTSAPYQTRILVARPTDPAKFNGTVLAEWENVSAQAPAEPGMVWLHHHMIPKGYAYVAINAQSVGVRTLQAWDPVRYASLTHPGDDYSFDIFSQAVQAIRGPAGSIDPMGGLHVSKVIGYGQSQSAGRLNSYMNLAQNDAKVLDGVIIQADGGTKKSFPDLRIPLIHFETQDSIDATAPDPANNSAMYRLWEVVGASHVADEETQSPGAPTLALALTIGTQIPWALDDSYWQHSHYGEEGPSAGATCAGGVEFPVRYALDAALDDMNARLTTGTPIPQPDRASFDPASGALQLDANGNAVGGLRLPTMMVPVATYDATTCSLLGITVPFTPDKLLALYPTHGDYMNQMSAAINADLNQRVMVQEDANELLAKVNRSFIPLWRPSTQLGL